VIESSSYVLGLRVGVRSIGRKGFMLLIKRADDLFAADSFVYLDYEIG
jgi:hypothetical protein